MSQHRSPRPLLRSWSVVGKCARVLVDEAVAVVEVARDGSALLLRRLVEGQQAASCAKKERMPVEHAPLLQLLARHAKFSPSLPVKRRIKGSAHLVERHAQQLGQLPRDAELVRVLLPGAVAYLVCVGQVGGQTAQSPHRHSHLDLGVL